MRMKNICKYCGRSVIKHSTLDPRYSLCICTNKDCKKRYVEREDKNGRLPSTENGAEKE